MPLDEAHAARRRAELLWEQKTRMAEARETTAEAEKLAAQKEARLAVDANTARLRALRLAKEAADRAAVRTTIRRLGRKAVVKTGEG